MIVPVNAVSQPVLFSFMLRELQLEWTAGASLFVSFVALVRRLALRSPVSVQHEHAVSVCVHSFSSLAYHFDILRRKYLVDFFSDVFDVFEVHRLQRRHVDLDDAVLFVNVSADDFRLDVVDDIVFVFFVCFDIRERVRQRRSETAASD